MRLSVFLLLVSLTGILGGGWLIGLPAFGAAVIFDSLAVGTWALLRDDGSENRARASVPGTGATVQQIFDRARSAS